MNSEVELDSIVELINNSKKIAIFAHESPDGDAIGSSLAMYLSLKSLKKDVYVVGDSHSRVFDFLDCVKDIKSEYDGDDFDLGISLDCASKQRLYDPKNLFDKCRHTIVIDHHISNTFFGEYNYVEGKSPAASQTIVKILRRLNVNFTKEIGECLMVGIITDTGGFRYDTVDSETFTIASRMIELGVNISDIYLRVFTLQTKPQFLLSRVANSRLEIFNKNRVAFTYITMADEKEVHASEGDHEGIVDIGRNIEGVEVSIFLRETEKGFKASLRSNEYVNVSEVASIFSGGGHIRAAGCTLPFTLEQAREKIVERAKLFLK